MNNACICGPDLCPCQTECMCGEPMVGHGLGGDYLPMHSPVLMGCICGPVPELTPIEPAKQPPAPEQIRVMRKMALELVQIGGATIEGLDTELLADYGVTSLAEMTRTDSFCWYDHVRARLNHARLTLRHHRVGPLNWAAQS